MFISTYKGFSIAESTRHGKAVKGAKKANTIQVRDHRGCQSGYFLRKQIKYSVGDLLSRAKAIEDAKKFIDELLTEAVLKKDESKHTKPPISQTPLLCEVPQEGHLNNDESLRAVGGATPAVVQNEQTEEHFFCFKADAGEEYYCDEQCWSCANPL